MAMGQQLRAATAAPADRNDADKLVSGLNASSRNAWELATRLQNLKDAIFGPEPAATAGEDAQVAVVGLFQRLEAARAAMDTGLGRCHQILNEMERRILGQ